MNAAGGGDRNQLTAPWVLGRGAGGSSSFLTWLLVILMGAVMNEHQFKSLLSVEKLDRRQGSAEEMQRRDIFVLDFLFFSHNQWMDLLTFASVNSIRGSCV